MDVDGNEEEEETYEGSNSEDDSNDNSDESGYASFYGAQNLVTATFVQTPIWLRKILFCLIFAQMEVPANTKSKYID